MRASTAADRTPVAGWRDLGVLTFCLVVILGALFARSFDPAWVVFSNDGPLGAARSQSDFHWGNFISFWLDLNWLGSRGLGAYLSPAYLLQGVLGPFGFAKFMVPLSLLLLGLSAWLCLREFGFGPAVCVLGGLAAALNMNAFSISCWGLSGWALARADFYLALAAVAYTRGWQGWVRAMLGGFAVGLGLMDGLDVGAIYSLYVAAFVLFLSLAEPGVWWKNAWRGVARVAVVAICAAVIAAQALTSLIGTQVKGIAGMQQDAATKERRWTEATLWSLPKAEALRLVIPGLFGYRMPELYGEPVDSTGGGNYWGGMGQQPGAPESRHSGAGEFAGVLVVLVALWGAGHSLRRGSGVFATRERRLIWFWAAAGVISLLLAFGRHAPFYRLLYELPYFSTMRNPFKFLHPLQVALVILFGCGLQGICRAYVERLPGRTKPLAEHLREWWQTAARVDRRTMQAGFTAVGVAFLGFVVYVASQGELVRHLQASGFPEETLARSIALFSLREVGWFVLFLGVSVVVLGLMLSGAWSGNRARWAGLILGTLLVVDLVRADLPWIVHYNYREKYASNPVIDQLRAAPGHSRVVAELTPLTRAYLVNDQGRLLTPVYFDWLQHHFQFYRVPALDIIQMPRVPEFDLAYMTAFRPVGGTNLFPCGRLWELTSSRYVMGMSGFLRELNTLVDPGKQRFRALQGFDLMPKPGVTTPRSVADFSVVPETNGMFALFEYSGALPRAKLFSEWKVVTDDAEALRRLADRDFDPWQTVLVAEPPEAAPGTNAAPAGSVVWEHYEPRRIRLQAEASGASVLLLNDHHDPDWRVYVDGKPEPLLRCNYIMRGVLVPAGRHTVEFRFEPSPRAFRLGLAGTLVGVLLCVGLVVARRWPDPGQPRKPTATRPRSA